MVDIAADYVGIMFLYQLDEANKIYNSVST